MAVAGRVDVDNRGQLGPPSLDHAVAALSGAQHGVVARGQLRDLGLSGAAIDRRVATGRLHVVHRGVHAVGHDVLGPRGRWMAARPGLRTGCRAQPRLGGRALRAARQRGDEDRRHRPPHRPLASGPAPAPPAHAAPGRGDHDGIPVTTPARTILDLAAVLQRRPLKRLLDQAENTRLTDVPSLAALARAHPSHRGASKLLATLDTHAPGSTLTRSTLEELFLQLCRDHGLPRPEVNSDMTGVEVDFLFPEQRLIVETDSWRFHRGRHAFENDRHRDQVHTVLGYRTLRAPATS